MKKIAAVLFMMCLASSVQATLITVNDGDVFDYDPLNTYQFNAVFSATNPTYTFGVEGLGPGQSMDVVINAPAEFGLWAAMTTGPDYSGAWIGSPAYLGFLPYIPAGTSFLFNLSGDYYPGETNWLSLEVDSDALSIIETDHGGSFSDDSLFAGSDGLYDPGAGGGGTGGGGSGGGYGEVPEPTILALMSLGLMGLGLTMKKRKLA